MKKILLAAPLALSLALAGCNDMLTETPKNFVTTDTFYNTPADILSATVAAYQPITRGDVWQWWLVIVTELASDQVRIHPDEPNFGTYHPGLLLWTPSSSSVTAPWNGFYTSIYRANLVIDRAPNVTFPDASQQAALIAEAKFVRAYSYLFLTKLYGDVPLLLSVADHEDAANRSRTPVNEVHQQIVQDLTAAVQDLPVTAAAHGRASKGAARMALADLYQWRSSFLKTGEWQQMADWSKQVIDSGEWRLLDDYLEVFLPVTKGNQEVIWMVASSGTEGRTSTNVFCHWLPRSLGFGTAGGCEVLGQPTLWMYNSYPEGDYRHEVNYRTSGCSTNTNIGCITFDWPNVYKYRPTNQGVGGPTDVDFPLYRYAEALLMYAEAQFYMGNVGVATEYVNMVRARAKIPALSTVTADDIYLERNWELAHEGKRWFDLVRRDSLEPGFFINSLLEHDPQTASQGGLELYRKILPIPAPEMSLNASLTQNPGY